VVVLGLAAGLSGCASSSVFVADTPASPFSCEQRTPELFVLNGEIDDGLRDCVRDRYRDTTTHVLLNSQGGSVEHALDIAERFEGRRLTMRVEEKCNSSCANYFLPLAGRIEVAPGATILLHGSIDANYVGQLIEDRHVFMAMQRDKGLSEVRASELFDRQLAGSKALAARQATFAARNALLPGWLLYREVGSNEVVGLSAGRRWGPARSGGIVEEPMLRSCLPGVEIVPFQADLDRHWARSFRRLGLMWAGISLSGSAVCEPT